MSQNWCCSVDTQLCIKVIRMTRCSSSRFRSVQSLSEKYIYGTYV